MEKDKKKISKKCQHEAEHIIILSKGRSGKVWCNKCGKLYGRVEMKKLKEWLEKEQKVSIKD